MNGLGTNDGRYVVACKVYFWLLILQEVTLFLPVKANTYVLGLLCAFWLWQLFFIKGRLTFPKSLALFTAFAVMFAVGLLYTENQQQGLKEVEPRSALVVLPFILLTCKIKPSPADIERCVVYFFRIGLAMGVVVLALALRRYLATGDSNVFFYDTLTNAIELHPVYFSYFILFGLVGNFVLRARTDYRKPFFWLMNIFGVIMLVLLASKMVLGLLLAIIALLMITTYKFRWTGRRIVVAALVVVAFGFALTIPPVKKRIASVSFGTMAELTQDKYAYNHPFNGLSFRLVLWKLSVQHLYSEGHLATGVGTGDVPDFLNSVYARHGLLDGGYKNFNTHNEYVQTLVALGVGGLAMLLLFYGWGIWRSIADGNLLLMVLLLIVSLASLTEALLNVNKGIVFVSYFYPLLLLWKPEARAASQRRQ